MEVRYGISHNSDAILLKYSRWLTFYVLPGIRLAGGSSPNEGRVEVFHEGVWGTVCDDSWGVQAADIVCSQLGFSFAIEAKFSAYFGEGLGPIWLDNVQCSSADTRLETCSHNGWGNHNCGHAEDAGVICTGEYTLNRERSLNCCICTYLLHRYQTGWWIVSQ